ncbi:hypothetical protein HQO24_10485 [Rhodococcus fascians]|nr:hypothetical protein [Rhodococcus fascians]MBY4396892.1 hypothetical protein [Rhodococcus fascians]MBY4407371.1 hypothetical protein [Rhodococcus fascians]MBY4421500.1 hypothetical protein [Rhodococcus fascians]MBY4460747.1 hypothetical protein [Rhodococcus fascians]
MPGTPRKTAARKTAAKKAAPRTAPITGPAGAAAQPGPKAFDLLDALGTTEQEPVPVTLLGVNAMVRRSFSAAEDLAFAEHLRKSQVKEALGILVGKDADALAEKIDGLSIEQGVKVMNRLAQISTLVEGEALALLPTSVQRMVGALASRSSDGSTT